MKEKRFSLRAIVLTAAVTLVVSLFALTGVLWALLGTEGLSMAETMILVNTQFVADHDIGKAADQAMDALIQNLDDRWSYYMTAERYDDQKNSKDNVYVGIGVTVSYPEDGGLLIENVAEEGPAEEAGLLPGELILAVDGVDMMGEERGRSSELIQGEEGSRVLLRVRGTDGAERDVTVARGRVKEHPVSHALLEDGTGLVTIKNFNRRSASEAIAAVDELAGQGAKRLVFDVRHNGGGYLDELTKLLDHLLPEGTIFRSADRAGNESTVRSDANCIELPMAVLVNGDTWSAAEFFAAQLQEMDWGVIVGEPTFGKGFSQQTFALPNGGAINISTAAYFTGNGTSLIGTGLTLDREVALTEEEDAKLRAGKLAPEEDPQLQAAIGMIG